MTNADILASIRLKGFPSDPDLADSEITEAIADVQRDLLYAYPLETYGTFTIFANQSVYDLFNPVQDLTTSQGVFPGGLSLIELIWSPAGTTQGLSVFGIAPFLQGMTLIPGEVSVYSFQTPGDWFQWDSNWDSFVTRFGSQPFRYLNNIPGSPILLAPLPTDTQMAWCRYKKYRDPLTFQTAAEDESSFLMLVESYCCYVVARKLMMVAGATLGPIKASQYPALYWKMEGDRKYAQGWKTFYDHYYQVGSAVTRQ